MKAVFRSAPRKGEKPIGYRPVTGHPRDEHGNLILEWVYAPKERKGEITGVWVDEAGAIPEEAIDALNKSKGRQSLLL